MAASTLVRFVVLIALHGIRVGRDRVEAFLQLFRELPEGFPTMCLEYREVFVEELASTTEDTEHGLDQDLAFAEGGGAAVDSLKVTSQHEPLWGDLRLSNIPGMDLRPSHNTSQATTAVSGVHNWVSFTVAQQWEAMGGGRRGQMG